MDDNKTIEELKAMPLKERNKHIVPRNFIEQEIEKDIENKNITEIITRFPPEPNGFLHIGHCKALCIDFDTAEHYLGKTNLRFDDTNPLSEDKMYEEAIKRDVEWLGFKPDRICYASDYYQKFYELALKLIEDGKAYVDDQTADEIKETRGTLTEAGMDSPYRNRSIEENLDLFKRMKAGEFADGSKVLRAKIDMASPNMNMRDPVIYRISRTKHYRTGNEWVIYPMYDYAHPLEDAIEGITHSLCSLEFQDHRPLYDWVVQNCGFENPPRQIEFARMGIGRTIMSKRYLKKLVELNIVDGWDDPRMPTIGGMRRRGYTAEGICEFVTRAGVSKANSQAQDPAALESCVREHLNQISTRVMVVLDPLKVTLTNFDDGFACDCQIENNPNDENAGTHIARFGKTIYIERDDFALVPPPKYHRLKEGGVVRLKGAYIIQCDKVILDENGEVKELECHIIENSQSGNDTSGVKAKGVIHWVNADDCVPITTKHYDYLLKENTEFDSGKIDEIISQGPKNVDKEYLKSVYSEFINQDSILINKNAYAEKFLETVDVGTHLQFMRKGYFIKDCNDSNAYIETIGLKDSYNK